MHDDNLRLPADGDLTALRNLLFDCGGLAPGQHLLIVQEPARAGFYGDDLPDRVAEGAVALGLRVDRVTEAVAETAHPPGGALAQAMADTDLTLFLARRGDQLRFQSQPPGRRAIVCYALDSAMLFSPFGRVPYGATLALRDAIDRAMRRAHEIRLTCPLGTDFVGRVKEQGPEPADTYTYRFPLSVYTPLPAAGFSGQVMQAGFLVGTGSRYYSPYGCRLRDPIGVQIAAGQITGFTGAPQDVAAAEAHYADIAGRFGLDARCVHSWHAGIHPGCAFADPAGASLERWSGGAFGNPRLMHLHTCGAEPPGEISLNVLDPTITLDGVAVWESGRLHPDRIPDGAAILSRHPALAACFADPAQPCGAPSGGLSFD